MHRRQVKHLALVFVLVACLLWIHRTWSEANKKLDLIRHLNDGRNREHVTKGIIMAKQKWDNILWLTELCHDWTPYIYTTSTPPEPGYLVAPTARGREAVPYLDFIVTHYDRLPTYMAFIHAAPKQWHNDILGRHTLPILQNLHLDSVARLGYLNLRCTHEPGCPVSVNPHAPTEIDVRNGDIRASFVDVYMQIFGVAERELVPQHVGGVCCAQFAVSRERVLQRPREEYARMLDWAVNGVETDSFGVGWVFEKVWHIVFGMEAE